VVSTERLETPQGAAWRVAASVVDPELPMLTLADLGVLRGVEVTEQGRVIVAITPTYSGCPAMAAMREDLVRRLTEEGYDDVEVRIRLAPAWTTDWITPEGRAALAAAGISPPNDPTPLVEVRGAQATGLNEVAFETKASSVIPLNLGPTRRSVCCPRCGSQDTALVSEFGSTACKALYRCRACREPFDHVKEI
jgi:ring-1,2-phenylacetyl-CoA epoxidase subunit PaaD